MAVACEVETWPEGLMWRGGGEVTVAPGDGASSGLTYGTYGTYGHLMLQ